MEDVNLVLKFQLAGEKEFHVIGASRIKVDGHGALMFHDAQTGNLESIDLRSLSSFCIQPVTGVQRTSFVH